jgi:hypothetical protein
VSILGGQQRQGSILGGYNPIRQIATPFGQPGQPAPMMGAMGQGGGGGQPSADEWALQGGGPGALLWRQIIQGMSRADNPLSIFDPKKANKNFTAETVGLLDPRFQAAFAKGKGSK